MSQSGVRDRNSLRTPKNELPTGILSGRQNPRWNLQGVLSGRPAFVKLASNRWILGEATAKSSSASQRNKAERSPTLFLSMSSVDRGGALTDARKKYLVSSAVALDVINKLELKESELAMESQVVPSGKHEGKSIRSVKDGSLKAMYGTWCGIASLKRSPFVAVIAGEIERRGLKVRGFGRHEIEGATRREAIEKLRRKRSKGLVAEGRLPTAQEIPSAGMVVNELETIRVLAALQWFNVLRPDDDSGALRLLEQEAEKRGLESGVGQYPDEHMIPAKSKKGLFLEQLERHQLLPMHGSWKDSKKLRHHKFFPVLDAFTVEFRMAESLQCSSARMHA